jgi:hypothetical protein
LFVNAKTPEGNSAAEDNIRVGYQMAIQLWTSESNVIWAKFGGMATAHTILLGTIGLGLTASSPMKFVPALLSCVGVVICLAWAAITRRSFNYLNYCIRYARSLERDGLSPVSLVQSGRHAAKGRELASPSIRFRGRCPPTPKVEVMVYWVVAAFIVAYGATFIQSVMK